MDYRFVKAFLVSGRLLSFSNAAKELRIAQSAVSRQIKLLEKSLGYQLFFRSSKNVSLTEQGTALFNKLHDFDQWVEQRFHHQPVELKIAALDGLVNSFVIPRIASISSGKSLSIKVQTLNHNQIEAAVHQGEVDFALTYLPVRHHGYACKKLFDQKMFLISSSPLKGKDLSNECWIHMGRAEYLQKISSRVSNQNIVVNSLSSIVHLVSSGAGIATVPEHCLRDVSGICKKAMEESSSIYLITRNFEIMPDDFKKMFRAFQSHSST